MKKKIKINVNQIILVAVLAFFLVLTLFPFYVLIVNSLKTPQQYLTDPLGLPKEIVTSYFKFAWEKVSKYFINTIIIAVAEIILQTLVSLMAAYGFAKYNYKGKNIFFFMVLAVTMVPGVLTLIPSYVLVWSFGMTGSLLGVIIPQLVAPFNILLLKSSIEGVPNELFESAKIDGATNINMFIHIAIPLVKPLVFTVVLSTLLGCFNDLIWPRLILLRHEDLYTISVGIMEITTSYGQESFGMGVPLAAYIIVSIPLLLAFFLTSKQFISGLTSGAIKM